MYVRFTALPVVDQDRAVGFYTENLGFRVAQDRPYQDGWRWITLEIPGSGTKILLTRKPDKNVSEGVPALVLTVDDVLKCHQELKEKGVVFTSKPERGPMGVYGNLGLRVWPRKFERCGQEERATPAIRENSSLKQPNFKEESPRSAECGPD